VTRAQIIVLLFGVALFCFTILGALIAGAPGK